MPRPRKIGGPEPKRRSRNGCWPCKGRKVKCGEEKPGCLNCQRQGDTCDYSIRLNWEGRLKTGKKPGSEKPGTQMINFSSTPLMLGTMSPKMTVFDSGRPSNGTQSAPPTRTTEPMSPPSNLPASQHSPIQDGVKRSVSTISQNCATSPVASSSPSSGSGASPYSSNERPRSLSVVRAESQSDLVSTSQARISRQPSTFSYPSPAESAFPSPNMVIGSASMPPPFPAVNQPAKGDSYDCSERSHKRMRMSSIPEPSHPPRYQSRFYGNTDVDDAQKASLNMVTTSNHDSHSTPATPTGTDDNTYQQKWQSRPFPVYPPERANSRRVSVNSLLSGSPEPELSHLSGGLRRRSDSITETYGFDRGIPDLDFPRNNDASAISGASPAEAEQDFWSREFDSSFPEFAFGFQRRETAFAKGGYYASPVPIKIPRSLSPLPKTLVQNPMNLLYFHHFLNHTARILVPHDCSENPFKTILPSLAVSNKNVMNLLLAYSASHRARLLSHPEPANRIAIWVRDVFSSLLNALNDTREQISNANLATAIMLSSLEIISPSSFGIPVPWQNHLQQARQILKARGGPRSIRQEDPVSYFLIRWFAYLDVLGSLSGRKNDETIFSGGFWATHTPEPFGDDTDFRIDCLLGFTSRCATILAQIAELARQCDNERIDAAGEWKEDWAPSPATVKQAHWLRHTLEDARTHVYKSCPHQHGSDTASSPGDDWDVDEMGTTNSAFHWAGLIHIYRRVLGYPAGSPEVQAAVREIIDALNRLRKGGSAEACLLFPMFTAGCDALEPGQRAQVLDRLRSLEGYGMTQVHKARVLMEKVWETKKPWMVLVQGEFFG